MIRRGNNIKYTHSRAALLRELMMDKSLAHARGNFCAFLDLGEKVSHKFEAKWITKTNNWYNKEPVVKAIIEAYGIKCLMCDEVHRSKDIMYSLKSCWFDYAEYDYRYNHIDPLCKSCAEDFVRWCGRRRIRLGIIDLTLDDLPLFTTEYIATRMRQQIKRINEQKALTA